MEAPVEGDELLGIRPKASDSWFFVLGFWTGFLPVSIIRGRARRVGREKLRAKSQSYSSYFFIRWRKER